MSWEEYYRHGAKRFGEQADLYGVAAKKLHISQRRRSLNILLGGFYPFNDTPHDFVAFCREIHPNPDDKHIFMDFNDIPVRAIERSYPNLRAQGSLVQMPFRSRALDLIFLDFTTAFMNEEAVKKFAKSAYPTLRRNGLILIANDNPRIIGREPDEYDSAAYRLSPVQMHARSPRKLAELMQPFKSVFYLWGHGASVIGFARNDSRFEQINDLPGPPKPYR